MNKLSQDFNVLSLLKFAAPTTIMLVFMSLYQMVDGVFIANFIGESALSALNIIYPIPSIVIAFSIMLATGGNAIIAKNMGEGKAREAKENFSLILLVGLILGIIFVIIGLGFMQPIIQLLGATESLYAYCTDYLNIFILAAPLAIFQMLFQSFFVSAGKPHLGLFLTVFGGVTNLVLDYLFIVIFKWGMSGAALATSLGYAIPGIIGLIYFLIKRNGTLYIVKPKYRMDVLIQSCFNGSSEMVNNLAVAITTYIFNVLMLEYAHEEGVASITIVLYAQFLLTSVFMGFSSGVSPIVSYNYGRQNYKQLQKVMKISTMFTIYTSLFVFVFSELNAASIIRVFASAESELFSMTMHGFKLFSVSYLFTGINIYVSSIFTALSNGKVSAILSLLRTFVFLILSLIILPYNIGLDGVWLSVPVAEGLSLIVSLFYGIRLKNQIKSHKI